MNLLILDGPRDHRAGNNPLYRGTYRAHPTHCDELPDDHEINRLFFWFLEEGGELGVVRDVSKALRLTELWNARLPEKDRFEVVEATDGNTRGQSTGKFIGFDLSAGYNSSLLSSGLKQFLGVSQLAEPIRELWDLASRHYAPQLNGQGLFQTLEVASLCVRSMIALQDLSPNLFEGGNLRDFQPVGLHTVTMDSKDGSLHRQVSTVRRFTS
jgi:hypothetical protein